MTTRKSKATDGALDETWRSSAKDIIATTYIEGQTGEIGPVHAEAILAQLAAAGYELRILSSLAALPPPTGEPVAWQYRYKHKASDKWSKWGDYDPALAGYSDWTKETRPLYAALAAEPGAAEGAASKFRLWFFRDLVPNDRRALFSLFGMPTDEITNHGAETLALRHILKALAAAPHQSGESGNG